MSKLKAVWWILLFAFLALFIVASTKFAQDTHRFLDACVAFFGVVGATFIGFGVLFSRKDVEDFGAHIATLRFALETASLDKSIRGIEDFKLVRSASWMPGRSAEAQSLENIAEGLRATSLNLKKAAAQIDYIFQKQVQMALDASRWFEIGISICLFAAAATAWFLISA